MKLLLCSIVCSIAAAQAQQAPAPPPPAPAKAPAQTQAQASPPAPVAQEPENIEKMLSVGLYDWLPSGGPKFRAGTQTFVPPSHDLTLPQKPSRAYGAVLTIPMKGNTRLEVSYLTMNDRGNALAPTDLSLFAASIAKGEPLAMDYSLRHLKLSWNYLTYPNPPQDAKFRIKTLWEVHFLQIYPTVEATVTSPGVAVGETQRIILPAVGLGMEYVPSKHFRMEWRGSGMGFPNRSSIGDSEATLVGRIRSLEIFAGGKFLYFRTSPKKETYTQGLLWGPMGGVRWVFR